VKITDYIIDFAILAIIYFAFFFRGWRKLPAPRMWLYTLTYVYISLVLCVTLMPFRFVIPDGDVSLHALNLEPFIDIKNHYAGAEREFILNIIMTIPFGFLLPLIKKRGIIITVLLTLALSLSIELAQLWYSWDAASPGRACDITDVISNTIGGLIGYLLCLPVRSKIIKHIPFCHSRESGNL
jgi:glycopeptide antibiotics resistance protein